MDLTCCPAHPTVAHLDWDLNAHASLHSQLSPGHTWKCQRFTVSHLFHHSDEVTEILMSALFSCVLHVNFGDKVLTFCRTSSTNQWYQPWSQCLQKKKDRNLSAKTLLFGLKLQIWLQTVTSLEKEEVLAQKSFITSLKSQSLWVTHKDRNFLLISADGYWECSQWNRVNSDVCWNCFLYSKPNKSNLGSALPKESLNHKWEAVDVFLFD